MSKHGIAVQRERARQSTPAQIKKEGSLSAFFFYFKVVGGEIPFGGSNKPSRATNERSE